MSSALSSYAQTTPQPPAPDGSAFRERQSRGASVLITDEHYKNTLGLVRHLGRRGNSVSVVAASRKSLVCRSHFCSEIIPAASPRVEAIVEATLRAIATRHYDIVIPVGYAMTSALAERKAEILRYSALEVADAEIIRRAANKAAMIQFAKALGVPAPKTIVPSGFDQAREFAAEHGYPLIIKPQEESPGHSVRYVRNPDELRMVWSSEFPQGLTELERPLLQQFVPGTGYGLFATYQNGVCKRVFMHRRVREYPAHGGASSCAESFHDTRLETYGRRMLDALRWHGVAMVEFRRDSRDGEFKLMEINPKLWGSLDLALAAGADFPGDLCRMAAGATLEFTDAYNRGLRFQWPLSYSGDLYHLWSRPQSFLDIARDFLNPRVRSNLCLSDLGPSLLELRQIGSSLLRLKGR